MWRNCMLPTSQMRILNQYLPFLTYTLISQIIRYRLSVGMRCVVQMRLNHLGICTTAFFVEIVVEWVFAFAYMRLANTHWQVGSNYLLLLVTRNSILMENYCTIDDQISRLFPCHWRTNTISALTTWIEKKTTWNISVVCVDFCFIRKIIYEWSFNRLNVHVLDKSGNCRG